MDISIIFFLFVLLLSVIIHEVSHGGVANLLGDPTAKIEGRLSLNPIKHLDPFGSVILPILLLIFSGGRFAFGWAKPVPINPYNFKDPKWDGAKVAAAGPGANILIALIFGMAVRFLNLPSPFLELFGVIVILNFLLALFNLLPIPPLDGSHILFTFLPESWDHLKISLQRYSLFILLFFLFFGLRWVFWGATALSRLVIGLD